MKKLKLTIDLIPSTSFMDNVRKAVSKENWDIIRKKTYREWGYACGTCGGSNTVLECHEIWEFDEKRRLQKLTGLIALCSQCHRVKHYGHAMILADQGKIVLDDLIAHFMQVNGCTKERFQSHLKKSIETWEKRSKKNWTIDLGECAPYAISSE